MHKMHVTICVATSNTPLTTTHCLARYYGSFFYIRTFFGFFGSKGFHKYIIWWIKIHILKEKYSSFKITKINYISLLYFYEILLNFKVSPVVMQRYKRRKIANLVLIGHKVSIICKMLAQFSFFLFSNFLKLFNYF